jgi:hypothetical protein
LAAKKGKHVRLVERILADLDTPRIKTYIYRSASPHDRGRQLLTDFIVGQNLFHSSHFTMSSSQDFCSEGLPQLIEALGKHNVYMKDSGFYDREAVQYATSSYK